MRPLITWYLWVALAGCMACHHPIPAVLGPIADCPPTLVDTAGWKVYDAGEFSLALPRSARPKPVQCIDSLCGTIAVGHWTLDYESGIMSGKTIDSMPATLYTADEHQCVLRVNRYDWFVSLFRKRPGDGVGGYATVLRWRGGRMTLVMTGRSAADLAQFATAVTTLRIHDR